MRKTTLFACLLLLTFVANANASYDDSRRPVSHESTSINHKLRVMPSEFSVDELISGCQMNTSKALSQNAPPTIRDGRTDNPPVPQPVLSPTSGHLVRNAQTPSEIELSFIAAGSAAPGFMPDGTPIIRDSKPSVPAPVPPNPPHR